METRTQPATQAISEHQAGDIEEQSDENGPLIKNEMPPETNAETWSQNCDLNIKILSCIALLFMFIGLWIVGPALSLEYKQANKHLNGTLSHSPKYTGFGKRPELVCKRNLSIGKVLAAKSRFYQAVLDLNCGTSPRSFLI